MDNIDSKILSELQKNSRISNADLAEKIGLSPTPCLRRLRRLESDGLIQGYRTDLNLQKLGFGISALIFVQLTLNSKRNAREFEDAISSIHRIQECLVLTGQHDYLLKVVAKDLSDYEHLVKGDIADIPNIKNIESTFVLNQMKLDFMLPLKAYSV